MGDKSENTKKPKEMNDESENDSFIQSLSSSQGDLPLDEDAKRLAKARVGHLSWSNLHWTISQLDHLPTKDKDKEKDKEKEAKSKTLPREETKKLSPPVEPSPISRLSLRLSKGGDELHKESTRSDRDTISSDISDRARLKELQKHIKEQLTISDYDDYVPPPSPRSNRSSLRLHADDYRKISITNITTPERATIVLAVDPNWTMKDIKTKVEEESATNVSHLSICIMTKKNAYSIVKEDQTLAHVLKKFEGNGEFVLANTDEQKKILKKVKAREIIPSAVVFDAIRSFEIERLGFLLNSPLHQCDLSQLDPQEGYAPIHAAVRSNDPTIVKLFLDYYTSRQFNINVEDAYGWTILHHAISTCTQSESDEKILRMILSVPTLKADAVNHDGNTPLHYFCQRYLSPSCVEFGNLLISKGPEMVNVRNRTGETPLHKAIYNPIVRVLMVKLLIEHGADANSPTLLTGETALHYAVRLQRSDLVKILLHSGADIRIREKKENKTPYQLAVQFKEADIIAILQKAEELNKWLIKNDFSEYLLPLIKDEMFLEELAQAEQNSELDSLLQKLGINATGNRIRFKHACKLLSDKFAERDFESRVKQAKSPSTGAILTPELKTSLSALLTSDTDSWLIKNQSELEFTKEIGNGTSGKVYKGLLRGNKVAVKVLKAVDGSAIEEFKKEFAIMKMMKSDHVVHFFGASLEPKISMIMEYCNQKSMNHVLHRKDLTFTWDLSLNFILNTISGLHYLHMQNILHRDMKSLNLLVHRIGDQWSVKLADFGMARFDGSSSSLGKICGTYSYLAPEITLGGRFTEKADIFSTGIILWEIIYRTIIGEYSPPYSEYPELALDFQIALRVSESALRPTIPENCPESLRKVTEACWQGNPEARPKTMDLVKQIPVVMQDYRTNRATWDSLLPN
eukprot:TRINITY_DN1320_c0_g1_i1.p1 TRINITY_DN1320_c0_g1~~TRINITY_DN1320_c0_g1_i1.p1  ORF type:complete len:915 (+),score=278.57 TRINITY_DN1320_c0_g1_i1:57-2801(+)